MKTARLHVTSRAINTRLGCLVALVTPVNSFTLLTAKTRSYDDGGRKGGGGGRGGGVTGEWLLCRRRGEGGWLILNVDLFSPIPRVFTLISYPRLSGR